MWGATSTQVLAMGEYLIDAQVTVGAYGGGHLGRRFTAPERG
jgi:hypothetical protein